ncbi:MULTISPECIES: hypothetical protein [unclassified Nostoc]|nr:MULTISPECIES: hypothetical protein [unclassified Nostoc]
MQSSVRSLLSKVQTSWNTVSKRLVDSEERCAKRRSEAIAQIDNS